MAAQAAVAIGREACTRRANQATSSGGNAIQQTVAQPYCVSSPPDAQVATAFGGSHDGSEHWLRWDSCKTRAPCLDLRNARSAACRTTSWRGRITLEGFSYASLGGFGGDERQDMRNRSIEHWRDWLSRDPVYSTQPYTQLASVLATAGNREGAADIRFFGRDRGRSELLRGCPAWLRNLLLADKLDADSKNAVCGNGFFRPYI